MSNDTNNDGWIDEGSTYVKENKGASETPTSNEADWLQENNEITRSLKNPGAAALPAAAIGVATKFANPVVEKGINMVANKAAGPIPLNAKPSIFRPDPTYSGVEKWSRQMHSGNFYGGERYKEAYELGQKAKEAERQAEALRKAEALFKTEAELASTGKAATPVKDMIAKVSSAMTPQASGTLGKTASLGMHTLGRALGGASAAYQGVDAVNRYKQGDYPGMIISGLGSIGSGAALIPTPVTRVLGTGVGLSAEAINAYRDAMRKGEITHNAPENYGNADATGNTYAQGGLVHLAEGGSVMPDVSLDVRQMPSMNGMPGVGYMQTPQAAMARLQLEKEMELARLRAGVSGMAMAIPGQQGVRMMPGQMDIGANIPMGPGNLDISANRSINPIPGRGHMQGVNARYTIPFAEGGGVKKSDANEGAAFIGYPQINKNRKIGSGTGFLDALVGAPASRTNILNPSDYSYMEGYEKGEPYGIAGMMLPFTGAAAKPLAREMATKAFMGESLVPKAMRQFMPEAPALGVVKQKGGNWAPSELSTGFDTSDQLSHVKTYPTKLSPEYMQKSGYTPEDMRQHLGEVAVDDWVDKQLSRYVKNDMGTPEDPIRALAEKGILHFNPSRIHQGIESEARVNRGRSTSGANSELAVSDLAKNWEARSDAAIRPQKITPELAQSYADEFPWLNKSVGQDMYHSVDEFLPENLGFDHIADVLRDQIRFGQLRPESLKSLSVPQAVERAHEYNLARQRAMEKVKIQQQSELPVQKEYPEGYKWYDLKHPTKNDLTEQALEYEGNAMGHCVGGYCPEVISGKTKIYSLRDAKGEPHVTIEVRNTPHNKQSILSLPKEAQDRIAQEVYGTEGLTMDKVLSNLPASGQRHSMGVIHDLAKKADELFPNPEQTIEQIKGKQNAAPKEEYQKYVQDFVRSGNWSDIKDLQNSGLLDARNLKGKDYFSPAKTAYEAGELPRFITQEELDKFQ